ncbi:MAG: T9SS type A sorting domain-containing protein [Bacteroidota bacterium]
MKHYTLLLMSLSCFFASQIGAQNCNPATAQVDFQSEFMSVRLLNGGDAFWDLADGKYLIPYNPGNPDGQPSAVFASSIWIGGFDDGDNLRMAAQTYRQSGNDYWPGPLDENGQLTTTDCENFDQIWLVTCPEIQAHIDDFSDNGIFDDPTSDAILGWPARGNSFFEGIYGFQLPDQDLAPFYDSNDDGIYDPSIGEYPVYRHDDPAAIPRTLAWFVFNDVANVHGETGGLPLGAEVQHTYWTLTSENFPLLNYTLFRNNKIINKGQTPIDSFYLGSWIEADVGCFDNDFTGSIPELNTFYFYNGEAVDNFCGVDGYGDNPPVFSSTYLNATLTNYHQYNSDFNITGNPEVAPDFYNYLNGRFKDGMTPVEYGGNGFNQGTFPYPWYFPSNPNDLTPGGWSEVLDQNDPSDRRGVGGTGPYDFHPNAIIDIDQAFCFFQDSTLDHIETVNLLYQQLPLLQTEYENNFANNIPLPVCSEDCIWPGDMNRDGIVDVIDFLRLKEVDGLSGPERFPETTAWFPFLNPGWQADQVYSDGVSYANADCNGDGQINVQEEFNTIQDNYRLTNNSFDQVSGGDIPGQHLYIQKAIFDPPLDAITPGTSNDFDILLSLPPEEQGNIAGIAFEIFVIAETTDGNLIQITNPFLTTVGPLALNVTTNIPRGFVFLDFASVSTDGQTFPNDPLIFLGRFNTIFAQDPIDCTVEIRIQNVQAIRADGTFFTIENEDSFWPVVGCEVVNTEDPNIQDVSVELVPNPSSERVTLFAEELNIQAIEVFDITGRQVTVPLTWDTNPVLTVQHLPEGVYVVRLQTDQGEVVKRMIVQR